MNEQEKKIKISNWNVKAGSSIGICLKGKKYNSDLLATQDFWDGSKKLWLMDSNTKTVQLWPPSTNCVVYDNLKFINVNPLLFVKKINAPGLETLYFENVVKQSLIINDINIMLYVFNQPQKYFIFTKKHLCISPWSPMKLHIIYGSATNQTKINITKDMVFFSNDIDPNIKYQNNIGIKMFDQERTQTYNLFCNEQNVCPLLIFYMSFINLLHVLY